MENRGMNMKTLKSVTKTAAALLAAGTILALSGCDNPFRSGLGARVDITPPSIDVVSPGVGSYIKNEVEFIGTAQDDIAIKSVSYRIETGEWKPANYDSGSGEWRFKENVSAIIDGDLRFKFRATDNAGKNTETDYISYYVKNQPPKVEMQIPLIREEDLNAVLASGGELGPNNTGNDDASKRIRDSLRLTSGGDMGGNISDPQGIKAGTMQIRFWPVAAPENYPDRPDLDADGLPPEGLSGEQRIYDWQDVLLNEGDKGQDRTSLVFQFPLRQQFINDAGEIEFTEDPLPVTPINNTPPLWRFQIRVTDTAANPATRIYPAPGKYVEIQLEGEVELPLVDLWLAQEPPYTYTSEAERDKNYSYPVKIPNLADTANQPHPYIDSISNVKQGPITLRLRASHSKQIWYSSLSYRRTDLPPDQQKEIDLWTSAMFKKKRVDGRYELETPLPAGSYEHEDTINELDPVAGNPTVMYNTWEYKDDGSDYIGVIDGQSAYGQLAPGEASAEFTFTVTTRSRTAAISKKSYIVRIDRTPPEIELVDVKGAAGKNIAGAWILNGVVEPSIRASDPHSGLNFQTWGTAETNDDKEEKFWLVLDSANETAIKNKLDSFGEKDTWLPLLPQNLTGDSAGGNNVSLSDNINAVKAGWITNNEFRIDTQDGLTDGVDYYFYIFARNKTWKSAYHREVFHIDQNSDKPVIAIFDRQVGSASDPAVNFDPVNLNNTRKLGFGEGLKIQMTDDDMLNIAGISDGVTSSLRVSIRGFKINTNGTVSVDGAETRLSAAQLKKIFGDKNVKDSGGKEIPQNVLAQALNPVDVLLPEGLYYMNIYAEDNPPDKLKMRNADPAPAKTANNLSFWFAVDTDAPVITLAYPTEGAYGAKGGPGGLKLRFYGTVTDKGGPLVNGAVNSWAFSKITEAGLYNGNDFILPASAVTWQRDTSETSLWKYNFEFAIDLGAVDGTRGYTFTVTDYYNRPSSVIRHTLVDNSPPSVSVEVPPATSAKNLRDIDSSAPDQPEKLPNSQDNPDYVKNYVNGVIQFTIGANDNFVLDLDDTNGGGLKWWLIPHNAPAPAYDDPFPQDVPANAGTYTGLGGVLSRRPFVVRVNTKLKRDGTSITGTLPDSDQVFPSGKYKLYILAKDKAGNKVITTGLQASNEYKGASPQLPLSYTIDQRSDLPEFRIIRPQGVEGLTTLMISGTLADDDGFQITDLVPAHAPVQVRISPYADTAAVPPDVDEWLDQGTNNGWKIVNNNQSQNQSLKLDAGLVSFEYGLSGPEKTALGSDGRKRFMVKVTDAPNNKTKLINTDPYYPSYATFDEYIHIGGEDEAAYNGIMFGSEQTRVYTFILDTKSPEFKIRDPMVDPSVTITGNEWNETLVPAFKNGSTPPKFSGELTEANLKYDRKGQFGTLPDSDKPGGVNPGSFHITVTVSDKQNGKDVVWTYALRQTDSANNNALNYITTEAEHQGGDLYKWVVGESGYYRDGASIEYYPDPSRGGDYTKNVFEMLADGPHTITFSADDESAKTTSKPYSFVKDNTPPAIQYTNLYGDMYLSSNGNERPGTAAWESKDETAKKKWLAERLALKTVITSNTPVLSGSFSDTASDIYEKFQYRIDSTSSVDPWNDSKISTDAGYDETKTPYISGTGKTVQWYIPIGEGTANALLDGLHWVEIKATDTAGGGMGNTTADANVRKIYFILDRGAPRIFGLRASPEDTSYGTPSPGATLVTLSGLVVDENLQSMLAWLDTSGTKYGVTILSSFTPDTDETQAIYNWLAGIPDPAEKTRLSGLIRKWQWSMTANEFNHTALGGSAFSGSKSIRIGAYDFSATDDALAKVTTSDSGQGKAHIEWKFTKDSTKPTFTWPNINRSNGSAGTASADKRFVGMANPQLQGSASDANSGVKSVETYLERWNYSYNNGAGRYELLNPDPTASGSPDNGWYALPINAGQKTVNWSKSLAGLPEGLYRISFRVKDISVGSGNPYVTSTETPSQGYAEFFIGSADPDLEIVPATPFKNYYPGGDIVLSGTNLTAASVNRIKTITVKLIEVSTSITEVTRTLTPGSGITYDALVNWNIKQTCTWTTTIAAPTAPTRDGAWRIEITAEDYAGRKRTKTKDFTLDNTKPTLTLEDPKPEGGNDGAIVPAGQQLVVSGGSSDLNGIDEFYWYAGIKNLDDVNAAVEGTKDGWKKLSNTNPTLNVWDSSGGAPSDVKVTSNTNPYSWSLTFIEDATYHSIRSLAQNDGFTEPTNQGGYRKLILRFKVKDKTGNIKYFDHYLWIDLEADIPGAVITSPATGISRGGAIQISGTVSDNEAVNRVVFRVIDASGSPVPSAVLQTSGGVNTYTVTEPGYPVLGTPSYVDTAIDALGTEEKYKGGWQEVMLRNGFTRNADPKTGSFDFVINSTGLLDPDDPADPIGRKVRVQVRALDGPAGDENIYQGISTYGKSSDIEINITAGKVQVIGASTSGTAGSHIYVTFDAGTGTVNHFSPSVTYHGNITFNAIIRSVNPLKLAQWQDDINHGSASFTPAVDPSNPPTQSGGYYTYNVSYTMNTASFTSAQGKIFEHGAGNYNFTITAQDNDNSNPMTAQYTFAINIDNSVPWAQYYPVNSNPAVNDGTNSLSSNPYVAGTNYTFSGRALDADPDNTLSQKPSYTKTGSLEKVVFWIKKGGAIVNLLGNAGTATTVSMSNIPKQQRGPYALDGSTSFTTVQVTAPKHDVQNIDGWRAIITATESGADSPSGLSRDGIYPVGFSGSGNARDWNLRLDTTKLPDGPATACYLLYDAAGNVSYHEQDIVVRNQAPVITQVKLSTGLQSSTPDPVNGAKTLNTFTNGKLVNADFIARNNALRFEVTTNRGTRYADTVPRLRYRLAYVSSLTLETASLSAGDYYLIKTAGTNVNWQNFGAVDSSPGTVFYANDNAPLTNGAEAYKLNRTADQTPQTTITPDVNDPVTQSFDFTNFANIPDAGTTGYAAGVPNHNANNQSLFLLKIWDYNQPGPEAFQLSEVVLIGLKVQNTDTEKPVVEVYPLNPRTDETVGSGNPLVTEGMKPGTGVGPAGSGKIAAANRSRPGLFNKTSNPNDLVKSGHIEPRTGSPVLSQTGGVGLAANDTVSGAIILRGYATDNQRIRYIDVNINNAGWTTILEAPGGGGSLAAASGQRAWITDEIDLAGHRVEWSWVWDTETLGVILGAETVEVRARDYAANISDRVTTGNNRNYFSVDAAAYVTGIERPVTNGASGAANRSKQGWYAFYQGETGITLKGYNLKTASSTPSLTLNGTTLTTSVPTIHSITFSVPASISKGGAIVYRPGVTVGTTDSVNNRVSRAVSGSPSYYRPNSWNQETWRNTAGSTLWTDQLNAHVWRTLQNDADANNRTAIVNSANGEYGAMAMNPNDGKLYATWRQYSTNRIWMGGNSSTVATNSFYMSNYDDIHRETDIAFGAYGGSGGKIGNNNPRMHWVSNYLRDFGTGGEAGIYTGYRELTETGYTSNYKQLQRPSFSANQFQNPRVTATEVSEAGYADRTYTSFYDSTNARLVFYRHSWGGNDGTNANMRTGGITLDGSVNTNTAVAANGISRSTDAGLWSAIDYDSSNFPVVAYYDSVDNNLRIAYSDSVNPTAGANWTRTYVLPTSHPYFNGSGTYVSMKIQRTGTRASDTIHLAFINTVYNTVVYAKGTFAQLGLTAFTAVAVDSTGAAPNWTDIAVDKDGSPWISYGDKRLGGKDGIKLAYKDATKFTRVVNDTAGNAVTGWETMSVPTQYSTIENRISMEAWPAFNTPTANYGTQTWNAAIGYNSDRFRIAYFTKP